MTHHNSAVALKVLEPAGAPAEPPQPAAHGGASLVGLCIEEKHPTLAGRVRIRWHDAEAAPRDAWLPQLHGVGVREGDRVLLMTPANHDEQVVVGVLDGIAEAGAPPTAEAGPVLRLAEQEAVRIAGPDGEPLVEIRTTEAGPEVRLFAPPAALTFPGSFRVSADQIEFEARKGEVRINAAGDIKVVGEIIRLN